MDIVQAKDFLSGLVLQKQKEIDSYNLALDLLNNSFVAEFTSRDNAVKQAAERAAKITEKDTTISNLTQEKEIAQTQLTAKETEVSVLQTTLTEKETMAANLQMQLDAAEARMTELTSVI